MHKIPEVLTHHLWFHGIKNSKEVCTCPKCEELRKRRDSIFKRFHFFTRTKKRITNYLNYGGE